MYFFICVRFFMKQMNITVKTRTKYFWKYMHFGGAAFDKRIEEAFFILKPDMSKSGISESEILKHANKILDKSLYDDRFNHLAMNVSKKKGIAGLGMFF